MGGGDVDGDPHVSGTLALLLAQGLGPSAAVERLLATLDRSVPCGLGCQGRLNTKAAVTAPPPTTTTAPPAEAAAAAGAGAGEADVDPVLAGVAGVLAMLAAGGTVGVWRRRAG